MLDSEGKTKAVMPTPLPKFIGLLILFATIGIASCQAFLVA